MLSRDTNLDLRYWGVIPCTVLYIIIDVDTNLWCLNLGQPSARNKSSASYTIYYFIAYICLCYLFVYTFNKLWLCRISLRVGINCTCLGIKGVYTFTSGVLGLPLDECVSSECTLKVLSRKRIFSTVF